MTTDNSADVEATDAETASLLSSLSSRVVGTPLLQLSPLVNLRSILDGAGTEIEHSVGSIRFMWSASAPDLLRIRDTADWSGNGDVLVLREQIAYVLETHRAAVRMLPKTAQDRTCDRWETSRWSLGREICVTLRTRGFYAPDDCGSADVISAVGSAVSAMLEPLREYAEQVRIGRGVDRIVRIRERDFYVSEDVLSGTEALFDRADFEFKTFERMSAQTGAELLDVTRKQTKLIGELLSAAHITVPESRITGTLRTVGGVTVTGTGAPARKPFTMGRQAEKTVKDKAKTAIPQPSTLPEMHAPIVPEAQAPVTSVQYNVPTAPTVPAGFLTRPTSDNVEACALYDRLVELLLGGAEMTVGENSEKEPVLVACYKQRMDTTEVP